MATLIARDTYHVFDRKNGGTVTIVKDEVRDEKDPVVKLASWAFISPEDAVTEESPTFGPVEAATAVPGRKRSVAKGGTRKAPVKK